MTKDYKSLTQDVSKYMRELRKLNPDAMAGFSTLAGSARKSNAVDAKTKEFIALVIGVVTHCDSCIGFRTKALHTWRHAQRSC